MRHMPVLISVSGVADALALHVHVHMCILLFFSARHSLMAQRLFPITLNATQSKKKKNKRKEKENNSPLLTV